MKYITRCHHCFGSGKHNGTCPTCDGRGWYFSDIKNDFWIMNVSEEEASKYAKETTQSFKDNLDPHQIAVLDEYASMIDYYYQVEYNHNEMLCSRS